MTGASAAAETGSRASHQANSSVVLTEGFDPARIPNGPELWSAILAKMPPGSIVAGGAVRDYLLGYEPKDIDVFMGTPPVTNFDDAAALDQLLLSDPRHGLFRIDDTHERFEEYAAVSCILCVSSGTLLGYKVDAVEIEHFAGGEELVEQFDFGLTRCWFDGEIHDTPEAQHDRANKTATLLLNVRKERSLARFERLKARWGDDWKLDASAIEAPSGVETGNTDSTEGESAAPQEDARLHASHDIASAGPWFATYFTKPDGSPIENAHDVAETVAFSALESDLGELHGVTLGGEDDGIVVCYTGNGPRSAANARLIAAAPELFEALERAREWLGIDCSPDDLAWIDAALAKARGEP